jgi:AraC-like DNA-binding protein
MQETASPEYPRVYLYRRIVQTKLFIDRNYANCIDLNIIAEEGHFSKFHFVRLFKKTYGKTPHQYLTAVRIERAMELMRAENNVSEACFAVGFESLSSFSGLFKRVVGLGPSAYLAQQQQLKAQIAEAPLQFIPGCFAEKNGWRKNEQF